MRGNKERLWTLIVLTAVFVSLCLMMLISFAVPLVMAGFLSVAFWPVHERIRRTIRSRTLSALISTLAITFAIVVPAVFLGMALTNEITSAYHSATADSSQGDFSQSVNDAVDNAINRVSDHLPISAEQIKAEIMPRAEQAKRFVLGAASKLLGGLTGTLIDAFFTVFILFFVLRDGRRIVRRVRIALPLTRRQSGSLFRAVVESTRANLYGVVAVALAQGILQAVGFLMFGLPSPILWGAATAVLSLLPIIGAVAVWLPAGVILLLQGAVWKGVLVLGWGAGVVSMVDNIIRPWIIGGRIRLNTLQILIALLGGVQVFGAIGLFLGPVILSVTYTAVRLLRQEIRAKETPRVEIVS